jgi:hypothetical protein
MDCDYFAGSNYAKDYNCYIDFAYLVDIANFVEFTYFVSYRSLDYRYLKKLKKCRCFFS